MLESPTETGAAADLASAYSACYPGIRRHVARLVGESDADDVAQDAFVKALHSLTGFRGSSLKAWLYRIATNAALDRLRSPGRTRLSALPFDEASPDCGSYPGSRTPSVEAGAIRGQMSACVRALVDLLPENQRRALLLSEVEGLSDAEIAGSVGASVGSVKIRLHRARARLRQELAGLCRISVDREDRVACEPVVPVSRILRRR
jgi:RNA polymerase sigma-70 factor (ECF subfamily)